MIVVVLDPRVLGAPSPASSAEEFRSYVERLLNWKTAARIPGLAVTLSGRTLEQLAGDNVYPIPAELQASMRAKGVTEYDLKTLQLLVNGIAQLTPKLEDRTGITSTLHANVKADPDVLRSAGLEATIAEAAENLVKIGLATNTGECSEAFAVALAEDSTPAVVELRAEIHLVDPDAACRAQLPMAIEARVSTCSNLNDLAERLEFGTLFRNSETDEIMATAIKLEILRSRSLRGNRSIWEELPKVFLGREFRERAQEVMAIRPSLKQTILDSLVEICDNFQQKKTHVLRDGDSGANKARTHGGWTAWRHDVAGDVHVHYWANSNGQKEFAWVSHPHDDMYIPAPSH